MSLRIGIDAHYLDGIPQGVKSILENQIEALRNLDHPHRLFFYHKAADAKRNSNQIVFRSLTTNAGQFNYLLGFPFVAARDTLQVFQSHYILPFWVPCATVVCVYDVLYELYPKYFGTFHTLQMKTLVKRSVKAADQVMTISEFSKAEIVNRYHVDPQKVHVVPCGVSKMFRKQEAVVTEETLARLKIPRPYILCVGRKAPIKNLPGMIRAFAVFSQKKKEYSLVIVGPNDPTFVEKNLGKELRYAENLQRRILFTGGITDHDLVSLYNGTELFVFPSFGEGFGLPALEAMACGVPVLCSNLTSIPEIAQGVVALFNPKDQSEFNDSLLALIDNTAALDAMRKAGPAHAARYTWESYAQRWLEICCLAATGRCKK
jgi:glycosyltransferase involved in cell wall biosynthesis